MTPIYDTTYTKIKIKNIFLENKMTFRENYFDKITVEIDCKEKIFEEQSDFQKIEIFETKNFGKMLVLDGDIMLSDKDEFVYHEMISHMPLTSHPNPKKVLVVGGGDGGAIREIIKHDSVEEVILCEIDEKVVRTCQKFFPDLTSGLNDKRVKLAFEDGFKFIDSYTSYFDVILTDSSEPVGFASNLFKEDYYRLIKKSLKPDGIMVSQSETPWFQDAIMSDMTKAISNVFINVETYCAFILLYPSGFWTFTFASDAYSLHKFNKEKSDQLEKTCKYYNTEIHKASLALPNFVKKIVTNR